MFKFFSFFQSSGPFTVFAPTDKAFEKFIGERGDEYRNVILSDKTLLQYILLQHVTPVRQRSNELTNGMEVRTLADNTLTIMDTKDGLTIAGKKFQYSVEMKEIYSEKFREIKFLIIFTAKCKCTYNDFTKYFSDMIVLLSHFFFTTELQILREIDFDDFGPSFRLFISTNGHAL